MKVEYVNPFLKSAQETFSMMLQMEITAGKPVLKKEPFASYDISGIIGMSGDAMGAISLSFPKTTALKAVSRFLGTEIKIVGPEVSDAVGELTNIIAGSAKKDLQNMEVSISLPNVVIGKSHRLANAKDAQNIVIPFSSEIGEFAVEVSLKTK